MWAVSSHALPVVVRSSTSVHYPLKILKGPNLFQHIQMQQFFLVIWHPILPSKRSDRIVGPPVLFQDHTTWELIEKWIWSRNIWGLFFSILYIGDDVIILWCYHNTYHIFFSRERALWNTVNVWDHVWRVTWRCFEHFGWSACVRSIEFPVLLKLVWQDFPVHSCKLCLQQFAAEFVSIRRCVSYWSCLSVYCFYKLIWSAPTITEKSLWESKVVFIFSCNSWVPS